MLNIIVNVAYFLALPILWCFPPRCRCYEVSGADLAMLRWTRAQTPSRPRKIEHRIRSTSDEQTTIDWSRETHRDRERRIVETAYSLERDRRWRKSGGAMFESP